MDLEGICIFLMIMVVIFPKVYFIFLDAVYLRNKFLKMKDNYNIKRDRSIPRNPFLFENNTRIIHYHSDGKGRDSYIK